MITYEDLVKQLKQKQFAPVYLLMGEEPFYIDQICKYFENRVIEEADRDFNQVVLYGKDSLAEDVIANAKQFPFGSQFRLVILKEAKDLRNFDLLESYVQNPMPSTILVICYKYGEVKKKKAFEKHGVIFSSQPIRDYDVAKWVKKQAAFFHYQIDDQTSELLAEHIGNNLTRIFNEFEKLRVLLPAGSTITPDVVEKHIGISKEYNIFELQEALGTHNVSKAYKIMLNFVKYQKEHPNVQTIAQLFKFYHGMLRYHLSPDKSFAAQQDCFGSKSPYYLKKLVGYAEKHTIPQLINIVSIIREYDAKSKGVEYEGSQEDLLKEMIFKIIH